MENRLVRDPDSWLLIHSGVSTLPAPSAPTAAELAAYLAHFGTKRYTHMAIKILGAASVSIAGPVIPVVWDGTDWVKCETLDAAGAITVTTTLGVIRVASTPAMAAAKAFALFGGTLTGGNVSVWITGIRQY